MDLTTVWKNTIAQMPNVNQDIVNAHIEKTETLKAEVKEIAPIVHCDVMNTLYDRDKGEINHSLIQVLQALKFADRTVRIVSTDPESSCMVLGDLDVAEIYSKGSNEMLQDVLPGMSGGKKCELIIDDTNTIYKMMQNSYADHILPQQFIR